MIRCPWCNGLQSRGECFLGRLGRLRHYRCRLCAGQWSKRIDRGVK
jgi:hypothetical protein